MRFTDYFFLSKLIGGKIFRHFFSFIQVTEFSGKKNHERNWFFGGGDKSYDIVLECMTP